MNRDTKEIFNREEILIEYDHKNEWQIIQICNNDKYFSYTFLIYCMIDIEQDYGILGILNIIIEGFSISIYLFTQQPEYRWS